MEKRTVDDEIAIRQRQDGWSEDEIKLYVNIQNKMIDSLLPTGKEVYSINGKEDFNNTMKIFEKAVYKSLEGL